MHVAGQPVADLAARIDQPGAVVEREVHRLGVQHLAALAESGTSQAASTRATSCSVTVAPISSTCAGQPVAARPRPERQAITWSTRTSGHLLRRLHRGADRAFGLAHRVDLAERTPRERVVAAPITRNADCPASEPTPSARARGPSKRSTRQAILEVPMSRIAITPRCIAARRIAAWLACCW
jgi:hypothetical protein